MGSQLEHGLEVHPCSKTQALAISLSLPTSKEERRSSSQTDLRMEPLRVSYLCTADVANAEVLNRYYFTPWSQTLNFTKTNST